MSNFIYYKLRDACREKGCPVCRVENESVVRYLENQLYENVNSPRWRDRLRSSLGFCREHAWLAVDKRLGDALGFSIIYQDVVNSMLVQLERDGSPPQGTRHWTSRLRQVPEQARTLMERLLAVIVPTRHCPICEHQIDTTRTVLSVLIESLNKQEMADALQTSDGLCLPHLQQSIEHVKDVSVSETLFALQREKLGSLRDELVEFIRKNDYQSISDGFGREGDAWLRAVSMVVGRRRA